MENGKWKMENGTWDMGHGQMGDTKLHRSSATSLVQSESWCDSTSRLSSRLWVAHCKGSELVAEKANAGLLADD